MTYRERAAHLIVHVVLLNSRLQLVIQVLQILLSELRPAGKRYLAVGDREYATYRDSLSRSTIAPSENGWQRHDEATP